MLLKRTNFIFFKICEMSMTEIWLQTPMKICEVHIPLKNKYYLHMKKIALILFVATLTLSCAKSVSGEDISKINGYWEIEKVDFPDGDDKEYSMNEIYDFFQIKEDKGFRTKVSPQLDGTFLNNGDSEELEIKEIDGAFYIHYTTPFSKWKEKVISISDQQLVLENDSKKEYHYKRATPINIIPDGKKTK